MKQGLIKYDHRSELPASVMVFTDVYPSSEISDWKEDPQYNNKWRIVNRYIPNPSAYKKLQEDSIAAYKQRMEAAESMLNINNQLLELLGKPFQNEIQKVYVNELLNQIAPVAGNDAKSISKDMEKNKVSKKLKDYLERMRYGVLTRPYKIAVRDYNSISTDWEGFYRSRGKKTPPMIYVVYNDTVENPYYYSSDAMIYGDGWDWYNKDNLKSHQETYPISISYGYDPAHPEYRFKENYVFDNNGNLVRVLLPNYRIWYQDFNVHSDNPVFTLLARKAYEDNEYEIKSDDSQTNHYVKNQLGLEELTAAEKKEQDKRANAIASSILGSVRDDMKYGRNSKKGRAQQNKHAANLFGAIAGGSNTYYSSRGAGWLSQIENDYWNFFRDIPPYKFERIDETTIKVIYADSNGKPTIEIIYKYTQNKPYNVVEEVSVNKLFNGPASKYKP
ncbi:MAG: hypothetical protein K2N48_11350 [Muribaculaceae bacterium]|nr:hypothetical protein [Muribaculaceae bacterium]